MMPYLTTQSFYIDQFRLSNSFDQLFFYNNSSFVGSRSTTELTQIEMTIYSLFKDFTPVNVKHLISWLFLKEQLFGTHLFRFSVSRYKLKRDHRVSLTLVCELKKDLISSKVLPFFIPTAYGNHIFATLSTNRYSTICILFMKKLGLSYSLKNYRYFYRFFEGSPFTVQASITHSFLKHNLISRAILSYYGFLIL